MIKLKKNLCLLILFLFLFNCQSVKDGLTGQKSSNTDEFLIKKKNPLTLPPEFDELPKPDPKSVEAETEDKFDIKKIIESDNIKIEIEDETSSLENSIIKKINKK